MTSASRTVGEWTLEQQIGSGSFAVVWKARHLASQKLAAIKEINIDSLNKKLQESLASEISVLQHTKHKNVVQLLDIFREGNKIYLALEYCEGGDLANYIKRNGKVSESTARYFLQHLAEGLKELRLHNVIHRDLKPQNLLLSSTGRTPALKIADFGFARSLQPQGLAETLCGSPLYMAPEILQFQKYDAAADLWSVGTILFELVVGKPPFNGANHLQLLRNIESREARLPEALAAQLSPECRQLIHALLKRHPVQRLSFEQFFDHPFLKPQVDSIDVGGVLPSAVPPRQPAAGAALQQELHHKLQWIPTAQASAVMQPPHEQQQASTSGRQQEQHPLTGGAAQQSGSSRAAGSSKAAQQQAQPQRVQQHPLGPSDAAPSLSDSIDGDYVMISSPELPRLPASSVPSAQLGPGQAAHHGGSSSSAAGARAGSSSGQVQELRQQPAGRPSSVPTPAGQRAQAGLQPMPLIANTPPSPPFLAPSPPEPGLSLPAGMATGPAPAAVLPELPVLPPSSPTAMHELGTRMLDTLQQCAEQRRDSGALQECLVLQLFALRLLQGLVQAAARLQAEQQSEPPAQQQLPAQLVEAGSRLLKDAEATAARAAKLRSTSSSTSLPNAWCLLYNDALAMGRAAGVDELMGNCSASLSSYSRASDLLLLLQGDTAWLGLPKPVWQPAEQQRLLRYQMQVRARHQAACTAAAAVSTGAWP